MCTSVVYIFLIKFLLLTYPNLGEYHEFEQVFVKTRDVPVVISSEVEKTIRKPFFCQIDNERHPASDSAYECQDCGRRICRRCYIDCQTSGITTCPYCQGKLKKIQ